MNVPNRLTCLRIFLAVVFMALLFAEGAFYKSLALAVFLAASFTDFLDGRIARRKGQVTRFGKLMDPVADKLLTVSAFVMFVQLGLVPGWMVVLVIMRDVLITGVRLAVPSQGDWQAARLSGKQKTALQFSFIVATLVFLILRETPQWNLSWEEPARRAVYFAMFFVLAVTLWSGARYLSENRRVFN